jgi:hypothetical protein
MDAILARLNVQVRNRRLSRRDGPARFDMKNDTLELDQLQMVYKAV